LGALWSLKAALDGLAMAKGPQSGLAYGYLAFLAGITALGPPCNSDHVVLTLSMTRQLLLLVLRQNTCLQGG
jgi:hypothetical protein